VGGILVAASECATSASVVAGAIATLPPPGLVKILWFAGRGSSARKQVKIGFGCIYCQQTMNEGERSRQCETVKALLCRQLHHPRS